MKKKIFISCGILLILIVLLVPFKYDTLSDGGTRIYSAPLLKIVQWVDMDMVRDDSPRNYITSIYFFPENLKDIGELKKEHFRLQNISKEAEIDLYAVLDLMDNLVRYIDHPINSKADMEQTDFLYFLFYLALKENKTQCEMIEYTDTQGGPDSFGYGHERRSEQHTVGFDVLAEYMGVYFGIGEKYFDKYKNGNYEYKSPHDFYDADTDTFKFLTVNDYLWGTGNYFISRMDTKIYITRNEIAVKTMYMYDPYCEDIRNSADYKFNIYKINGETYLRLVSVGIYADERNKNAEVVLSIDGNDYIAPWIVLDRNGKPEYHTLQPFRTADFHSWSFTVAPHNQGIGFLGVNGNTAYFMVAYMSIYDVYLYDLAKKTGCFMSGAENFVEYYKDVLELLRSESGEIAYAYFDCYIVSMPPDSDFVLIRRSKDKCRSLAGEYYMLNLKTGEKTYICDSYTRDYLISYMEESYVWINENHLMINVFLENGNPTYDVIYDGENWKIT